MIPTDDHSAYWGETGFRSEFTDTGDRSGDLPVDQTHHFAMYLSGGINARSSLRWSGQLLAEMAIHIAQDNFGDKRLGIAGLKMGFALAKDPSQLPDIGRTILRTICTQY